MEITEIRVAVPENLADPGHAARLLATANVTFDGDLVVREVKIVQGRSDPFLAMPNRRLTDRCLQCRTKNHLQARFCNSCGTRLLDNRYRIDDDTGRPQLFADLAHPVNSDFRRKLDAAVLGEWERQTRKEVPA